MIQTFDYYIKNKLIRTIMPNINVAKSLLEKAELRLNRINKIKIEEKEASLVFEDIYESCRESAQSLMEIEGYKPYSHESVIAFLRDKKLLQENNINKLDNYRILRNNSVYKAEPVSLGKCKEALKFSQVFIPEIKVIFEKLNKKDL